MSERRKLAAILVADVVGYSRLTGLDEEGTLARLRTLRSELFDPTIAAYEGRVVKRMGDGIVIEFQSVVEAVRCSLNVVRGWSSTIWVCRKAGVLTCVSAFISVMS